MTDSTALLFSTEDIELLARTADALSSYLGKPVLVEVVSAAETGFEWAVFAIPLDINEDDSDIPVVQIGGANTRLLGSQGGVQVNENETYTCRLMWAIQRTEDEDVNYIKINHEGDENGWGETLQDVLPFDLSSDPLADDEDDLDLARMPSPSNQQH
ncbi:hypothetical protein [uncultured Paenalcaligenes sp.]|uniref:hypothetical protein n=1 Tax=uncultured Paenalcaligenes sp. TaxID=1588925 RepID=UPI00260613DA|nr:hypothetical protein [uncultured Paenalcaligenes sp.]